MMNCNLCGGTTVFISGNIVKCEYCGKLYSTANSEMNVADPERLYSSAVSMTKSKNEDSLKSAIEILEALGSYKDSSALANSCRGMIAQSRAEAEELRLATERQAEMDRLQNAKRAFERKQKIKIAGIVIATICGIIGIAIVTGVVNSKNKTSAYEEAIIMYSQGQYEEAREIFAKLGDYSDAATYVTTIDSYVEERESSYEKGVAYYEKDAYSECITYLTEISDYMDASDYIEKSVEALYIQATEHYNAGEYGNAKEILSQIPANSSKSIDVEVLLAEIDEAITEEARVATYEQAMNCYNSGDYETAQRLFENLGDYEETITYLNTIGQLLYTSAESEYNNGNYSVCFDILNTISSSWNEYDKVNELMEKCKQSYYNNVSLLAEKKFKEEGLESFKSYVDSCVCNIFSSTDATDLKDKHVSVSLLGLSTYAEGGYIHVDTEYKSYTAGMGSTSNYEDNLGVNYSFGINRRIPNFSMEDSYLEYYVKEYSVFTGKIILNNACKSSETPGYIRIYGDEQLIFTSDAIMKGYQTSIFSIR